MIQLYGSLRDHLFWAVCTLALPVYGLAQRIADGAARIGATLFGELLNAVFANVGQRAIRKVARETFDHLLNLDLKFHLSRQTGGLTRAIDRGTKCAKNRFLVTPYLTRIQRDHFYSSGHHFPHCAYCT